MDVFEGHRAVTRRLAAPCIAIGNFDGVHLGHRALLDAARRRAAEHGGTPIALTFDPHPTAVLAPHRAPALITSRARKLELLAEAGMAATVVEPFTPALAALPAAEFVDRILVGALGVRHVVVGWDFTYGQGRGGTTETLREHGARAGFGVDVVEQVTIDGEPASSTLIRAYLAAGDLATARRLLGRHYDVDGVVVRGAQRGRAIGFPTANLEPDVPPLCAPGIYAGWAGDVPAAISLGTNPTFVDGGGVVLEAHLLDWSGDLYGQRLRVRFAQKIRDEAKFDGADALVARIHADVVEIRSVLRAFLV